MNGTRRGAAERRDADTIEGRFVQAQPDWHDDPGKREAELEAKYSRALRERRRASPGAAPVVIAAATATLFALTVIVVAVLLVLL